MIWNAILKLTWFVFIQGPLSLIAAFNKVLEFLTGGLVTNILFGSSSEFHWNNIPMQFWWFVVVALSIFALIFTIQMIILLFKEATETKIKLVVAIQNSTKAFAFMFLIPIFFFIANFIVQSLANTVINHFGNSSNIAEYLYHIGDPEWDGKASAPSDYGPPSNIGQYNMIAQIFGSWFMLFAIFMIGITLVQKVIELFFLFILSPIIMIVMVLDDGKAAFIWKDMVIAKFLASTGTLIGYYIFISVTQVLLSNGLDGLDTGSFVRSLFIILFLCGGGLATMAFSDIIASFLGESAGIREGMSSMRSTMNGGMMALGAGKMVGKGIGFARSKRAGSMASAAGGFVSAASAGAFETTASYASATRNFSTYYNASNGLAARAGILGLAGLAVGATAIGVSNFRAGKATGGVKGGMKEFGRGLGRAATAPWKKTKDTFGLNVRNPKEKKRKSDKMEQREEKGGN